MVIDQKASDDSHTIVEVKVADDSSSDSSRSSGSSSSTMNVRSSRNGLPTGLGLSLADEKSSLPRPPSLEVRDVSHQILDIIFEYALNKFDDSKDRLAAGAAKFLSVIDQFVMAGRRVETCLPAFPFKSANKVYKVLGTLPDKAEELALERLNSMCTRIKEVYKPGARVTIISDGITYNGMSTATSSRCIRTLTTLPRPAVNIRSRYLGLRRSPAQDGCGEEIQLY